MSRLGQILTELPPGSLESMYNSAVSARGDLASSRRAVNNLRLDYPGMGAYITRSNQNLSNSTGLLALREVAEGNVSGATLYPGAPELKIELTSIEVDEWNLAETALINIIRSRAKAAFTRQFSQRYPELDLFSRYISERALHNGINSRQASQAGDLTRFGFMILKSVDDRRDSVGYKLETPEKTAPYEEEPAKPKRIVEPVYAEELTGVDIPIVRNAFLSPAEIAERVNLGPQQVGRHLTVLKNKYKADNISLFLLRAAAGGAVDLSQVPRDRTRSLKPIQQVMLGHYFDAFPKHIAAQLKISLGQVEKSWSEIYRSIDGDYRGSHYHRRPRAVLMGYVDGLYKIRSSRS